MCAVLWAHRRRIPSWSIQPASWVWLRRSLQRQRAAQKNLFGNERIGPEDLRSTFRCGLCNQFAHALAHSLAMPATIHCSSILLGMKQDIVHAVGGTPDGYLRKYGSSSNEMILHQLDRVTVPHLLRSAASRRIHVRRQQGNLFRTFNELYDHQASRPCQRLHL